MKFLFPSCIVLILMLFVSGCKSSEVISKAAATQQLQPSTPPSNPQDDSIQNDELFIKEDKLSYNGYEVVKLNKSVKLEDSDRPIEVSYAVIKKNEKLLAELDGLYHSVGNSVDFGLFSLFGTEQKQLLVSQTIPRGGRHWVVDLSSDFRILFDSLDYDLGREEFWIEDIDKDGIHEISLLLTAFWGFDTMSMAESPLPEIIFKYDKEARKYIPANPLFQDQILRRINENATKPYLNDESSYLSNRLRVFLEYVYAGEKEKAWSVFDREYKRLDKEEMKAKIKAVLMKEPVYKYIYSKGAT